MTDDVDTNLPISVTKRNKFSVGLGWINLQDFRSQGSGLTLTHGKKFYAF